MSRHSRLALIVCALAGAGSASAATRTGNLAVGATVINRCLFTSETLDFGTYTPGNGPRPAMARVFVFCPNGMTYQVGLGTGLAVGATEVNRSMQNGSALLSYGLFRDGGHTQNWGQASAADRDSDTGRGMDKDNMHRVRGLIPDTPANQLVSGGTYTDTVLVTITY